MKVSFEKLQEAFIDERITIEQLIEILVDNFGLRKTSQILCHNIKLALKKEANELKDHGMGEKFQPGHYRPS